MRLRFELSALDDWAGKDCPGFDGNPPCGSKLTPVLADISWPIVELDGSQPDEIQYQAHLGSVVCIQCECKSENETHSSVNNPTKQPRPLPCDLDFAQKQFDSELSDAGFRLDTDGIQVSSVIRISDEVIERERIRLRNHPRD